jgi:hypothetical protein
LVVVELEEFEELLPHAAATMPTARRMARSPARLRFDERKVVLP